MRVPRIAFAMLLAPLALAPRHGSAQVSLSLHLGNPVAVTNYSTESHGAWQTNYKKWKPTTMYSYQGKFYSHTTTGAHAVVVYHSGSQYFLPPRDAAWTGVDHRVNYAHRPTDDDYDHAGTAHRP